MSSRLATPAPVPRDSRPVAARRGPGTAPEAPPETVPRLSAIVPLLDEAETLEELHRRLSAVLRPIAGDAYEIVFVNDGSTDASASILRDLAHRDPRVAVVEFRHNAGKAAALGVGFREARGEILVTLDADLQDLPEEIPRLLARLAQDVDLVSGVKRRRRDPPHRVWASRLFNRTVSWMTGIRVRDVNSGLKAFRAECVCDIPSHGDLHRYLPVLVRARGYAIAEVDRRSGTSRYGAGRYLAGLLDTATVLLLTRYDRRPLHFFGLLGAGLACAGLGILTYLAVGWCLGMWIGNRPLLTLGVLTTILGLQTFFFGLLAELLVCNGRDRHPGYAVRRGRTSRTPAVRRGELPESA